MAHENPILVVPFFFVLIRKSSAKLYVMEKSGRELKFQCIVETFVRMIDNKSNMQQFRHSQMYNVSNAIKSTELIYCGSVLLECA